MESEGSRKKGRRALYAELPLVYSCSGCSSAAQLANDAALRLDREQLAEMSCIAGLGGDIPSLVRVARSGRQVIALDGCPLHCARHTLARHEVEADVHLDLSKSGIKKRFHESATEEEAALVWERVVQPALSRLSAKKEGD